MTTALGVPLHDQQEEDAPRPASAPASAPAAQKPLTADLINEDGAPTALGWRKIGDALCKEMPAKERDGRGGKRFSYINARQVARRLDAVVGPGNWATDWQCIRAEHPVAVRFGLALFGVWRWDVGYSNNPEADDETDRSYELEPLKAAVSDGLKRAAVQWGVGRFLYGD